MNKNTIKTFIFLVILSAILIFMGNLVGGTQGAFIAFLFSLAFNFLTYWFSDKIVLAMYGAKEIKESDNPELFSMIRMLANRANIPMPKVYIVPNESPNAFATGRSPSKGAVALTAGILRLLDKSELEGVISHELAHIKNRDTLIMVIAASIASAIMMIANMIKWAAIFFPHRSNDRESNAANLVVLLVMAIIVPIVATLVQLAISRSREYLADTTGAQIAGNKYGLINALKKLHSAIYNMPMQNASVATAHLMIANPFGGAKTLLNLFSTHPSLEARIKNLMNS